MVCTPQAPLWPAVNETTLAPCGSKNRPGIRTVVGGPHPLAGPSGRTRTGRQLTLSVTSPGCASKARNVRTRAPFTLPARNTTSSGWLWSPAGRFPRGLR